MLETTAYLDRVYDGHLHLNSKGATAWPSGSEEDLFERLEKRNIMMKKMKSKLKTNRGVRNAPGHGDGEVDDEIAFDTLGNTVDVRQFRKEIISFLRSQK